MNAITFCMILNRLAVVPYFRNGRPCASTVSALSRNFVNFTDKRDPSWRCIVSFPAATTMYARCQQLRLDEAALAGCFRELIDGGFLGRLDFRSVSFRLASKSRKPETCGRFVKALAK